MSETTISQAGQRPDAIVDQGCSPAEIARRLLAEHLTPEQLWEMGFRCGFTVIGGKTGLRYLIRKGRVSNVHILNKHGQTIATMCFVPSLQDYPRQELPEADVMLAQKIALEDPDLESEALRVANIRAYYPLHAHPELEVLRTAIRGSFLRLSYTDSLSALRERAAW